MTPTLSSSANDPTEPISATRAEHGLAGAIKNLAYAAIRPLRYQMLYRDRSAPRKLQTPRMR